MLYTDVIAKDRYDVRRMVFLADTFLEGHDDVIFYWGVKGRHDNNVKRNIDVRGIAIQISITQDAHCQIALMGTPDPVGIATGPVLWSGNLDTKATSFPHLVATAKTALIDYLTREEDDNGD